MEIRELEQVAKNVIEIQKYHKPQIVFISDKSIQTAILTIENEQQKKIIIENIRYKVKKDKIKEYVFISEAKKKLFNAKTKKITGIKNCLIIIKFYSSGNVEAVNIDFEIKNDEVVWGKTEYSKPTNTNMYSRWNVYLEDVTDELANKMIGD